LLRLRRGFFRDVMKSVKCVLLSGWSCFWGGALGGSMYTPSLVFSLLIVDGLGGVIFVSLVLVEEGDFSLGFKPLHSTIILL
jgi:hypothetical protein